MGKGLSLQVYPFTGKEDDLAVGLTYFGKRYLVPALGRWASADPLAVHAPGSADLNLYAYVSGQLLRATDPTGLTAVENQGSQGNSAAGDSTQRTEKPAEPAAPPPAPSGAEGSSGGEGKGSVTLPEMRIEGRVSGQHGADGGVGTGAGRGGGPAVAAGARGTLGATPSETAASVVAMRGRDALEAARSAAPNPFVGKSEYLGQPGKMLVEGLATGRSFDDLQPRYLRRPDVMESAARKSSRR